MIDTREEETLPAVQEARSTRRSSTRRTPIAADRQPPHSLEAEQGVLGCLLLEPNECIGECLERLRAPVALGKPEDGKRGAPAPAGPTFFYDLKHQTIFEALVEMYERREAIDLITLQQRLRDNHQLEMVGGVAYLSALIDTVPSAANLTYYLNIVWDKYLLRKMVRACTEMIRQAQEYEGDVQQLLDTVETEIHRINEERVGESNSSMKELVHEAIAKIEAYHNRQGGLSGLPTGFNDLDKLTDGLHPGEMIVIAARPSMGKTSLAMNIVEHLVLEAGVPVAVFSLEMTAESLVTRMMFSRARMNLRAVRDGFMAERDFPRLSTAAGKLAKAPLFIDDTPALSILQLRARARRLHHHKGIKLIVVDYMQLLHSTSRRAQDNRQQEISEISSGLKALAKELSLPVVVLSQLNRDVERDRNRKPRLSDLRESGAIEQDADLVGLLYKPVGDEEEGAEDAAEGIPVNLLIAKQRNGPTGDVHLTFLKNYTRFENAARVDADDVPTD